MFTTTLGRITVFAIVIATFCLGLFLVAAWSVNDAIFYEPQLRFEAFDTSEVAAKAFVVFDLQSGTHIASKNQTDVLPIASVTKLLTAAEFYRDTNLEATTTITWQDLNTEGAAGKLHFYEEYTHRELLFPLLLESSNDAAAAMLRVKPDLLQKMNGYAELLGLNDTVFEDTSGLSSGNVSTASDLTILARALYRKDPHIFDITKLTQFIGVHTGWMNNNPLVHMEGYEGGKHGFTYEANRTDVAFFNEELERGERRIIGYVLLGTDDIPHDIEILRAQVAKHVRVE